MITPMRERLKRSNSFEAAVDIILTDAIALQGAEFGNVQLLVDRELAIVAQRGFSPAFLKAFWRVSAEHGTACGRALQQRVPIMIADVEKDSEFAPFRDEAKQAGFRAVQSTPLVSTDGKPVGIVSTHFVNLHQPTPIEMDTLLAYSSVAADFLLRLLGDVPLDTMAMRMSDQLYAEMRTAVLG